jgi:hypothetical protein
MTEHQDSKNHIFLQNSVKNNLYITVSKHFKYFILLRF